MISKSYLEEIEILLYRTGSNISRPCFGVKMTHGIKGTPREGCRSSNFITYTPTIVYEAGICGAKSPGDLVEYIDYGLVGIVCFAYFHYNLWFSVINLI